LRQDLKVEIIFPFDGQRRKNLLTFPVFLLNLMKLVEYSEVVVVEFDKDFGLAQP